MAGKYIGPYRAFLSGDRKKAELLAPLVRQQMGIMLTLMEHNRQEQMVLRRTYPNGATIETWARPPHIYNARVHVPVIPDDDAVLPYKTGFWFGVFWTGFDYDMTTYGGKYYASGTADGLDYRKYYYSDTDVVSGTHRYPYFHLSSDGTTITTGAEGVPNPMLTLDWENHPDGPFSGTRNYFYGNDADQIAQLHWRGKANDPHDFLVYSYASYYNGGLWFSPKFIDVLNPQGVLNLYNVKFTSFNASIAYAWLATINGQLNIFMIDDDYYVYRFYNLGTSINYPYQSYTKVNLGLITTMGGNPGYWVDVAYYTASHVGRIMASDDGLTLYAAGNFGAQKYCQVTFTIDPTTAAFTYQSGYMVDYVIPTTGTHDVIGAGSTTPAEPYVSTPHHSSLGNFSYDGGDQNVIHDYLASSIAPHNRTIPYGVARNYTTGVIEFVYMNHNLVVNKVTCTGSCTSEVTTGTVWPDVTAGCSTPAEAFNFYSSTGTRSVAYDHITHFKLYSASKIFVEWSFVRNSVFTVTHAYTQTNTSSAPEFVDGYCQFNNSYDWTWEQEITFAATGNEGAMELGFVPGYLYEAMLENRSLLTYTTPLTTGASFSKSGSSSIPAVRTQVPVVVSKSLPYTPDADWDVVDPGYSDFVQTITRTVTVGNAQLHYETNSGATSKAWGNVSSATNSTWDGVWNFANGILPYFGDIMMAGTNRVTAVGPQEGAFTMARDSLGNYVIGVFQLKPVSNVSTAGLPAPRYYCNYPIKMYHVSASGTVTDISTIMNDWVNTLPADSSWTPVEPGNFLLMSVGVS